MNRTCCRPAVLALMMTAAGLVTVQAAPEPQAGVRPRYTIVDLGEAVQGSSIPVAINDRGDVVGSSTIRVRNRMEIHGLLWTEGRAIDLGSFGRYTSAVSINNRGQVILRAFGPQQGTEMGTSRSYLYERGQVTPLDFSPGAGSEVNAINDRGQLAGSYRTSDGQLHAFFKNRNRVLDLGAGSGRALNNRGQVAGTTGNRAALWSRGKPVDLGALHGAQSAAYAINRDGHVVGESDNDAFLWQHGRVRALGPGVARSINDQDQVVGDWPGTMTVTRNTAHRHAVLWQGGRALDLNALIPLDIGWRLISATGINNRGQVIGWGIHHGLQHAFLLIPG